MKLVAFQEQGRPQDPRRVGIVTEEGVRPTKLTWEELWTQPYRASKLLAQSGNGGAPVPLNDVALDHPLPRGAKVICIGLNYRPHAQEAQMSVPETPVLFSKFANSLTGSGSPVPLPANAREFDYEAELGVIVGQRARSIPVSRALECVFGYINCNDLSARDLQFRTGQWLLGKTLDGFLPVGPHLVTGDEIPDPQTLPTRCWVNGQLRQDSNTAAMIFTVAELISYISDHFTLEPGDLISTGTPEGVILGSKEARWLAAGDVVEVEVGDGRFGRLANRLIAGGDRTSVRSEPSLSVTGGDAV